VAVECSGEKVGGRPRGEVEASEVEVEEDRGSARGRSLRAGEVASEVARWPLPGGPSQGAGFRDYGPGQGRAGEEARSVESG
jgi:hypothetical protein